MKPFSHFDASTLEEAGDALASGGAAVIAGGTELLGALKDDIFPDYPAAVVNIKTVPGLDYIREEADGLRIGALTRLSDVAGSEVIQAKYTALAQAAKSVATPHIRDMGTIGGSIAQHNRCWYFRKPDNRFPCIRKGGDECFAILGDNRWHSLYGGAKVCDTPCTRECPAGTDIPGYFALLRQGDRDGAARRLMAYNPMPAITARVCAHFCQNGCNRRQTGEAVLICGIERELGDYILDQSDLFYTPPETETGRSVAVVGAGPAGLSAAYYLRRAGHRVTVFDTKAEAGGMLMYAIPAYRLPKDIVRRFVKALERMGVSFLCGTGVDAGTGTGTGTGTGAGAGVGGSAGAGSGADGQANDGGRIKPDELEKGYDAVCFATGAWKRPVIGIAGEALTVFGLDFLVQANRWMEGKVGAEVVVAGGGNVAIDVAVTAKRLGAKKVTLACLEPEDRMPAGFEEIERARQEGIVVMPSWGLSGVVQENGAVSGLELKRCLSPWDEAGRFNPQYDESEKMIVHAQNILMAVGQQVDLSFLGKQYLLQLDQRGLVDVAAESGMTSREGVFATGDVTTGSATVVGAVGGGRKTAEGICAWLAAGGADAAGAGTSAGAGAGTSTGAGAGASASMGTGASASTGTGISAGTGTGTGTSAGAGTGTGTGTGTSAGAGAGAGSASGAADARHAFGAAAATAAHAVAAATAHAFAGFLTQDKAGILGKTALRLRELDADKRRLDIEDSATPTREEALHEAGRCLNCGCYAVHPSDVAPALIALDAKVVTTRRTVDAERFFTVKIPGSTVLEDGELIREIAIPAPKPGSRSAFMKFAYRKSFDFPVVNCAVVTGPDPRVCLNAVAPVPYRAYRAERVLAGRPLDEALAQAAGEAAAEGAEPFEATKYKAQIVKVLVKRTLLSARDPEKEAAAGGPGKNAPTDNPEKEAPTSATGKRDEQ